MKWAFVILWPFILLAAIPLIFFLVEIAPFLVLVTLIGGAGAVLKRSF